MLDEDRSNMAAFLGTAGHEVIYWMHTLRNQEALLTREQILTKFHECFHTAIQRENKTPKIGQAFKSLDEHLASESPYYADLLFNYQRHVKNQAFTSTMHEQSFVLVIQPPNGQDIVADTASLPYLFTGQLDQAGTYDNGDYVLRDIKFRENQFRPSRNELDLNIQMTIYAAAMRYGVPACRTCKPVYIDDPAHPGDKLLQYTGPCDACQALIGTYKWPQQFPVRCEMVWMYDFEAHDADQHDREVMDKTKEKVKGPKGGKMYPRVPNPEWAKGYKAGDMKGSCYIPTLRTPSKIDAFMGDIIKICDSIREGVFYRRPSKHCYFCSFAEPCRNALELQVKEANLILMQAFGSEDPFG